MSAILSTYLPLDTHQPRGKQPWCATCDTDLEMGSSQTPLCTQQQPTDLLEAYLPHGSCGAGAASKWKNCTKPTISKYAYQ